MRTRNPDDEERDYQFAARLERDAEREPSFRPRYTARHRRLTTGALLADMVAAVRGAA